jgi:hypothetical protein
MAGRRAKSIEALHHKYGPVVQIGPNEVSFNAIDAVDIIYGPKASVLNPLGTTMLLATAYSNFVMLPVIAIDGGRSVVDFHLPPPMI